MHQAIRQLRWLLFFTIFVLFLLCYLFSTAPADAATSVSGTISQDTTWTAAGSPYVITGSEVKVAAGITLTVDSGVVVKFQQAGTSLVVNGTLNASGAVFTSFKDDVYGGDTNGDESSTSPTPGDWSRIVFADGGGGTISGCTVMYGASGGGAGQISIGNLSSSPTITGSTISKSNSRGIYITYGDPSIINSAISDNSTGGVNSTVSLSNLSGNTFSDNNGVAVQLPVTLGTNVKNNTYSGNASNGMELELTRFR